MANIGTLYNYGGVDILKYELGEELTTKIVEMYEKFVNGTLMSNEEMNSAMRR